MIVKHAGFDPFEEVFLLTCAEFDTPFSLMAASLYQQDRAAYGALAWRPEHYLERDLDRIRKDYCLLSLMRKYEKPIPGIDTREVALGKFKESETRNRTTNRALRLARQGHDPWGAVKFTASRKIAQLLGPFSVLKIAPFYGWGPGATADLKRSEAFLDWKMCKTPISVSTAARAGFQNAIEHDLHWSAAILGSFPSGPYSLLPTVFNIVDECVVDTVRKTCTTDRTIAKEPTGNLFQQKGYGGYIRKRLRSVGIDLDDQETNQRLAKLAVALGLATLDLKDASNSCTTEIVYDLLPYDWASGMDACRSRWARLPGERVRLEMFSSMGNGFTFELETLIFWALGSALMEVEGCKGEFSVYGDDIILPTEVVEPFTSLLSACGFLLNLDKSFSSGLFRESCGKHYFNGEDVTPIYQKREPSNLAAIRFHNRMFRWSRRTDIDTRKQQKLLRKGLRGEFRDVRLPYPCEGDDGLLFDYSNGFDSLRTDRNLGLRCPVVTQRPRRLPAIEEALLALELRNTSARSGSSPDPVNDRLPTYGDLTLSDEPSDSSSNFGWRWVYPPGVCILG